MQQYVHPDPFGLVRYSYPTQEKSQAVCYSEIIYFILRARARTSDMRRVERERERERSDMLRESRENDESRKRANAT